MQPIALAHWAHDIRNALSTAALYVDTLACPENPRSNSAVANTHALLARVASMCSEAAKQAGESQDKIGRNRFDVTRTIAQVRDLIASTLPAGVSLQIATPGPTHVMANPEHVFRILFNLLHNAAAVARRTALRTIRVTLERADATAMITVADDGPGLPASVRSRLFVGGHSTTGGSGYGLPIARELAERNGGILTLADAPQGTAFVVELPLDPSGIDRVAALFRARERVADPAAHRLGVQADS
jgi:signal transduction histidine kinase